jgi:hypothetical protein
VNGTIVSSGSRTSQTSWPLTLVALAASAAVACSGGSGAGVDVVDAGLSASFASSPTASAPGLVRLVPRTVAGDTVVVDVVIGGPTASGDLYSAAFDLVLGDPTVVAYEPGSAAFGDALSVVPPQTANVLVSQVGDRIVVGVSKSNGGAGNAVTDAQDTIVSIALRVLREGSSTVTFDGPPAGGDPVVLDPAGAAVSGVGFDAASASISGL